MAYKEWDFKYDNGKWYGSVKMKFHNDGDLEIFDEDDDQVLVTMEPAIALARAILKHYGTEDENDQG